MTKFKGYLDRLRENVESLDEAIETARVNSKKRGRDALQWAKTLKKILPPLESKGLVLQEPDPTDKRRMLLSLSELGIRGTSVYRGPDAQEQVSQIKPILPHTDPAPISPPHPLLQYLQRRTRPLEYSS